MFYNCAANSRYHLAPTLGTSFVQQDCTIAQNVDSSEDLVTIDTTKTTNQTCSIVYTRDAGDLTVIQMQRGNTKGTDYLYVKRENFSTPIQQKYLGLVNNDQNNNYACCMSFADRNLTFFLQGNISLRLQTPQGNKSDQRCPVPVQHQSTSSQRNVTVCRGTEQYSSMVHCYHRYRKNMKVITWQDRSEPSVYGEFAGWKYDTRCDIEYRVECNSTLDNRQVAYLCAKQEILDAAFIAYPPNMSNLNFSHSNLSSLASTAFVFIGSSIKKLDFAYNHLINIHTAFTMLPYLEVLYLNSNNITHLPNKMFQNLSNLLELDLHLNNLKTLENNAFYGLNSLTQLFIYENRLEIIANETFAPVPNLQILDLKLNQLYHIQEGIFHGLYNLTHLNLRGNGISHIPLGLFQDLYSLKILHLEHNFLSTLAPGVFRSLTGLEVLEINHNLFRSFHDQLFDDLGNLRAIILAKNKLQTLKARWFSNLEELQVLELWGNNVKTIERGVFKNFKHLNSIGLQGNQLETLSKTSFEGLTTLTTLDLYNNSLKTIQPGVFDNLLELERMIIAKNKLKTLPPDLFKYNTKLKNLDLSENRLRDLPFLGHLSLLQLLIIRDNRLDKLKGEVFHQLPNTVRLFATQPEICKCLLNDSNSNCKASAQESPYLTCKKMLPDKVLVIFMWVGGFGALFGNAIVLFWRKTQPQEEYQVQKMLIGNLALADLLMGMYMVVIASADVHYGDFFPMNSQVWRTSSLCSFAGALAITSSEASIMLLTVISIDRLIHIKYQMNLKWKPRFNTTKWTALSVWLCALVIAMVASLQPLKAEGNSNVYEPSNVCVGLPLAMKKVHAEGTTSTCINETDNSLPSVSYYDYWDCEENIVILDDTAPGMYLSLTIFLGLNPLCCVIIVGCYIDIVITVFRSVSQISRQRHMRHEIRMTVKVVAIIATDLCCWCPIIMTSILVQADVVKISPRTFVWIVTFILPINSVINPYIYTLGNVIADHLPKSGERSGSASRNTCTTNAERQSRPEPTNYASQYAIDENDFKAPLVEKPFVLMETCV